MIRMTGEPGGSGGRAGVSIADITAGMYAAFGILAALHARQTTGRGQFVDVSMLEGQLGILSGMIDRKSTRLNSSHQIISYAVFCLKKKKTTRIDPTILLSEPSDRRGTFGAPGA